MARKSKTQIWIEYLLARTVLGGLGMFPRGVAVGIGVGIARIGYRMLGSLRRTGMKNLEIAFPDLPVSAREMLLKGTFANLGRVLGEVSQFSRTTPAKIEGIVDFDLDDESQELYHRVKQEKRGVLITTGHLGNWELLVFAFAALHEPIAYLARPLDNPLIEELTVRIRTRFGNTPINKSNSVMTAIKMLRNGEILGVLADINAHPKEGVFVSFFGVDACTSAGPAMLAIRTNSVIVPFFCVYDGEKKRYKIVRGAILEPSQTGDREHDILETTRSFTMEIEKIIRQYPDQWLWIHKRWKTRPKGEAEIY